MPDETVVALRTLGFLALATVIGLVALAVYAPEYAGKTAALFAAAVGPTIAGLLAFLKARRAVKQIDVSTAGFHADIDEIKKLLADVLRRLPPEGPP